MITPDEELKPLPNSEIHLKSEVRVEIREKFADKLSDNQTAERPDHVRSALFQFTSEDLKAIQ